MDRRAIVLFTGDTRRESLQKCLPERFLSTLHRNLIRSIHAIGSSLIVASDTSDSFQLSSVEATSVVACAALGEKIAAAFHFAFQRGFDSVLILAGDVVVDAATLSAAFATLADRDCAVIGPSGDGGFYLAGLRADSPLLALDWNGIPWFTSSCATAVAAGFEQLGGRVSFLRSIDDVDSLGDAIRVTRSLSPLLADLRATLLSLLNIGSSFGVEPIETFALTWRYAVSDRAPPRV